MGSNFVKCCMYLIILKGRQSLAHYIYLLEIHKNFDELFEVNGFSNKITWLPIRWLAPKIYAEGEF